MLASKAHIDAMAAALRKGGLAGNLRHLRALAYSDLTQGRNPLDRITGPGKAGCQGDDPGGGGRDGPAALAELLRDLNVTLTLIARGGCDHSVREDRYTPSRKRQDLVRARTTRCTAPGCGAQACYCDLDHSVPYPAGITCQCDLGPVCRRHHRAKQAPGWHLSQPEPGVMRWTTPSGRVHTTQPAVYDG